MTHRPRGLSSPDVDSVSCRNGNWRALPLNPPSKQTRHLHLAHIAPVVRCRGVQVKMPRRGHGSVKRNNEGVRMEAQNLIALINSILIPPQCAACVDSTSSERVTSAVR